MGRILHIEASPREERSRSTAVARTFLQEYSRLHPQDVVETLNLYTADLPPFDGPTIQAKYSIMHGVEHPDDQARAWGRVEEIIDHFKAAEKYVFSVPMWNFGVPYRLKQYIDVLVQPGYTFSFDPQTGYSGLVTGRPAAVIYARGGAYSPGSPTAAYDLQKPYMELILRFIGFERIESLLVEPTLQGSPEQVDESVRQAKEQAAALAGRF